MAYLLHIETATEVCSVALSQDDRLLALREETEAYRHAERLTLMIDEVLQTASLKRAQLDAVVLSSGPGSYTSLRIGTSTAKGICYALERPLIVVDTLSTIAGAVRAEMSAGDYCFPMIDARRMEVYTAGFDREGAVISPLRALVLPEAEWDEFLTKDRQIWLTGNGSDKYRSLAPSDRFRFVSYRCSAKNLVEPGYKAYKNLDFSDLAYYTPKYLKPPNITQSKKKAL